MGDLINSLITAGIFKRFVSAIQAAELVDTLRGGLFTVFAPDDQAFAKLPSTTVEGLLKDVPKLTAVLMYHIVAGKLSIDEISKMDSVKTIQGQEINVNAQKWHLHVNPKINDANITDTDIVADNGLIQVLDKVLMPNMELTCQVCGMGFMTMDALNTHTKMGHSAGKEQELRVPPETVFEPKKDMEQMPVTREIPLNEEEPNQIPCPVCGKLFNYRSEMERHRDATHHESKGHE
jgi:Fasciclin domain/C2H2-type zinc finger